VPVAGVEAWWSVLVAVVLLSLEEPVHRQGVTKGSGQGLGGISLGSIQETLVNGWEKEM
jgi:hypothetical protein